MNTPTETIKKAPKSRYEQLLKLPNSHYFALGMFLIAYYYVTIFLSFHYEHLFWFTAIFVGFCELLFHHATLPFIKAAWRSPQTIDRIIIVSCLLLQSLVVTLWGFHDTIDPLQLLAIYATFILYIIVRTDWQIDGQLSEWSVLDMLYHTIIYPFKNFFIQYVLIMEGLSQPKNAPDKKKKQYNILTVLVTLIIIIGVLSFAITQLDDISQSFARLIQQVFGSFDALINLWSFDDDVTTNMILTLLVAAWLSGLVFGSVFFKQPINRKAVQQAHLQKYQFLPNMSAIILVSLLNLLYVVFFISAAQDLVSLLSVQYIKASAASNFAVNAFFQFINITLLNIAVIYGIQWLSVSFTNIKLKKMLLISLIAQSLLFALLASWHLLGIYVFHYGWTPLRLLSSWFVVDMMIVCLLLMIQQLKYFNAFRYIILLFLSSFTFICCIYPLLFG